MSSDRLDSSSCLAFSAEASDEKIECIVASSPHSLEMITIYAILFPTKNHLYNHKSN